MKKVIVLLTILVLVLSLAACGGQNQQQQQQQNQQNQEQQNNTSTDKKYKDGTYTGEGDKRKYGYEDASVTVKDGKITNIVLRRLEADGKEVNYDDWVGKKDAQGVTKPNLKQHKDDVAKAMLDKQSPEVDVIAGSTDSVRGWMVAVRNALNKATVANQ